MSLDQNIIALVLGILEGATEFLPVSSTGHMIIAGDAMGFTGERASVFEVFIQLGAILSVFIYYREKFLSMLRRENLVRQDRLSLAHIFFGMLPAMVIGFLGHSFIKNYLFSAGTVIVGLIVGGLFMLWAEKRHKPITVQHVDQLSMKQCLQIGLFQVLALWPGFSRSGSTIAGGLYMGVSRKAAADFSFIMAVPIMLIACIYDLLKIIDQLVLSDFIMFAIGFVTAFVVAYASIVWFLKFLNKSSLAGFAYYRFVVAFVAFVYFFIF
ncbi:undecaprenyl-diphosphate phosphatase [uncultured Veillonella sp.]|uniref:undecaprenyl-diphosphate phosphatase n=1 Tax=uncultured Veillonella sp. TaxID=159268 RepID=UPI0025F6E119|nr:undecaprenyl-diphosphate phosphatase [uncultured Veillonella sp.]MDY3974604.1 undecaprenyl-diphosphate phosphatase [Veillonella caviae]